MAQDNWSYNANTWDGPHRGQGHRGRRGRRGDYGDPYHWSRDDFDGPSGQGRDRGWGGRGLFHFHSFTLMSTYRSCKV